MEQLLIRENNKETIIDYLSYALNTNSKKADSILSSIKYKDILDYEGKEQYPVCLLLNMKKKGHEAFFKWCCDKKITRLKDLLEYHIGDVKEDISTTQYKLKDIVAELIHNAKTFELSEEQLKKVNEENSRWEQVCIVYDTYPFYSDYQDFVKDFKMADSTDYRISVVFTLFGQMGVVSFENCFDVVSTLFVRSQKCPISEMRKKRYMGDYFPNQVDEEVAKMSRTVHVNPLFLDLRVNKEITFQDLDGMRLSEIGSMFGSKALRLATESYDIITCSNDDFEEALLSSLRKDERAYDVLRQSKEHTNTEIGRKHGISPERVRQIIEMSYHKYFSFMREYVYEKINTSSSNIFEHIFSDELLDHIYDRFVTIYYKRCGFVIRHNEPSLLVKIGSLYLKRDFYNRIKDETKSMFTKRYSVTLEDACNHLLKACPEISKKYFEQIEEQMFQEMDVLKVGKSIVLYPDPAIRRYISSVIIHDFFPDGISISDEEDYKHYKKIASELFDLNTPTMHCMQARVHLSEDVIMIDKTKYIHEDYVKVSRELADRLSTLINSKLKNVDTVSVALIFQELKEELAKENVDSEYRLFGVLKYAFLGEYEFRKFYIYPKNGDSKKTIGKMCVEYIKEHTEGVTKKELLEKFQGHEKSMFFMITREDVYFDYTSNKYFQYDSSKYPDTLRKEIRTYIDSNMKEMGFVSCHKLYSDLQIICNESGIYDGRTLQGLCRKFFGNCFEYKYAFIHSKGSKALTKEEIIKQMTKGKGMIPYKTLVSEFDVMLGLGHHRASTELPKYSQYLFRYDSMVTYKDNVYVPEHTLRTLVKVVSQWFTKHNEMSFDDFMNEWNPYIEKCSIEVCDEAYPVNFRAAVQILEWNYPGMYECIFDGRKSVYYENAKITKKETN